MCGAVEVEHSQETGQLSHAVLHFGLIGSKKAIEAAGSRSPEWTDLKKKKKASVLVVRAIKAQERNIISLRKY